MTGYNITQNQKIASRAIIGALVLWLAFSGVAAAEQLYVNESGWWRAAGAFNASGAPIQAAVDAAAAGDAIYVWNGSYTENVDVNKRVTLQGEGADVVTVSAADSGDHVFKVWVDYVNISGFTVMGASEWFKTGICGSEVNHCNISNNNATNNHYGIYFYFSSNNTIINNNCSDNHDGIFLTHFSNDNTIAKNICLDNSHGVYLSHFANYNVIENNTCLNNYMSGIYLGWANDNNIVENNNCLENDRGIHLLNSSNNTLVNNTCNSNYFDGIEIDYLSSNNVIENNSCLYNSHGICLQSSSNSTVENNNCLDNKHSGIEVWTSCNNTIINHNFEHCGIFIWGSSIEHYTSQIIENNTVNGKPIYYYKNTKDIIVPEDAGQVILANCSNVTIKNINASSASVGIESAYVNNSVFENNTCSNNDYGYGIHLRSSNLNALTNNICNSNNHYGIDLGGSNNTIENNNCSDNHFGIYTDGSNNILTNNTCNLNNYGIYLVGYSSNNMLTGNTANSNNWCGIWLGSSSNNIITCNWVQNNTERGFFLSGTSTGNNISYNNIIENGNYNTSTGGWEWQFYIVQYQPIEAKHNYWGAGMNNSTIDASIYDDEEGGCDEVEFYPFETEPVPCAPTPEEPPAFTTADAAIALEIAVGSRPPDPRWDVSGDGSVTSLDALMILQAAAHAIDL